MFRVFVEGKQIYYHTALPYNIFISTWWHWVDCVRVIR